MKNFKQLLAIFENRGFEVSVSRSGMLRVKNENKLAYGCYFDGDVVVLNGFNDYDCDEMRLSVNEVALWLDA